MKRNLGRWPYKTHDHLTHSHLSLQVMTYVL